MDAQIQNQGGQRLAAEIKASLAEPQHRFELNDPFAETTFRFGRTEDALAKASKLGASGFQGLGADGKVSQIRKVDGEWKRDDGRALADIQEQIDKESMAAVEARAELRAALGQGVDAGTDKQMALADAHAFRRIQDPSWGEAAAVLMADNTRAYPEYKTALDKAIPGYPGTAEKIYALDAANTEKVMAKAERKAVEMASMLQHREDRAKNWTPEEAAKQAQRDSQDYGVNTDKTERATMRYDMALNTGANPAYQAALEKAAPEVAREVKDAQAAKTAAVAPAAESAQPSAQQSVGTPDNKIEADAIFTARQMNVKDVVPTEVEKQYLRVGDKFYHPSNTDMVAFEDKGNRLETKANSENVTRSMVRIAEARGWDEIKVSGSESFRRQVWLEAAARNMDVRGYTPTETDKVLLAKRLSESEASKIAKENKPFRARENAMAESFAKDSPADAVKKYPELAGAAAALAVIDKKIAADGLTPTQRAVVAARVHQNVVNSIERGDIPEVRLRQEVEVKFDGKEEQEYSR